MDENGPDWCEKNQESLIDQIMEGAHQARLLKIKVGGIVPNLIERTFLNTLFVEAVRRARVSLDQSPDQLETPHHA